MVLLFQPTRWNGLDGNLFPLAGRIRASMSETAAEAIESPRRPPMTTRHIDGVRFHDLRHSNASFLMRAGTHQKIVQARLGHATIKLTMDRLLAPAAGCARRSCRGVPSFRDRNRNGRMAVKDAVAATVGEAKSA
jgi:integrase